MDDNHELSRNTDPWTSHAAAGSLTDIASIRNIIAEDLYRNGPATYEEIAARTRMSGAKVWRRCSDLLNDGRIEPTGRARKGSTGRFQREYRFKASPMPEVLQGSLIP